MAPFKHLPVKPGLMPMEAKLVSDLPEEDGWQFEPKWDGFRCLVFREDEHVELQSKSGKPLGRYFPDVVEAIGKLRSKRLVIDGELLIPVDRALSFEALQMRLHPAASRVRKLAEETPALLMAFDCLMGEDGRSLTGRPLAERREALERLHQGETSQSFLLSPRTLDIVVARDWLGRAGKALDGVVAKRLDGPYLSGERAMLKVKPLRTADCVVGGFRYASKGKEVGSLLLGLYDDEGRLNHVGFTSAIAGRDKPALTRKLEALVEPPGFTGKAPGGPSRWSSDRSADWQPLKPELVAEVCYDHVTGDRFRHGTRFLRWRPDKAPGQCRMDQLQPEAPPSRLAALLGERVE